MDLLRGDQALQTCQNEPDKSILSNRSSKRLLNLIIAG